MSISFYHRFCQVSHLAYKSKTKAEGNGPWPGHYTAIIGKNDCDYNRKKDGTSHPFPCFSRADIRREFVFAEDFSNRVSSYISGLYDENEHQERPKSHVNADGKAKSAKKAKINNCETACPAINENCRDAVTKGLIHEQCQKRKCQKEKDIILERYVEQLGPIPCACE